MSIGDRDFHKKIFIALGNRVWDRLNRGNLRCDVVDSVLKSFEKLFSRYIGFNPLEFDVTSIVVTYVFNKGR